MKANCFMTACLYISIIALSACDGQRTNLIEAVSGATGVPPVLSDTPIENPTQPDTTTESPASPTASPDVAVDTLAELEITFVGRQLDGPPGIYSIQLGCPDENPPCIREPQLLFADPLIDDLTDLSWSPKGDRVVFSSHRGYPGPNLYISFADRSGLRNLTERLPKGMSPSWSPDGSQIAYASCEQQPCRILSIDLHDSTTMTLLGEASTYGAVEAVWAADAPLLAFNSYPNENLDILQIFVSRADGSEMIQVTDGLVDSYAPSISPDGKKVVYAGTYELDSGQELFISDLEAHRYILIANPDGSLSDPAWSPIGGWIVFKRHTEEEGADLFIVREDGSHLTQITHTPDTWEGAPAWRRITP